ncbi:hypothetical protein PAHAL_9G355000 [Panicum hallii]|uniref:Uncharacterized protein n=1 Tax=Panicum hallii TaxID=206008 RepID=A0A2S3INH1_9POAL|nr:hypothetical protein PAHAL_9G355000 [Panicum hallii]
MPTMSSLLFQLFRDSSLLQDYFAVDWWWRTRLWCSTVQVTTAVLTSHVRPPWFQLVYMLLEVAVCLCRIVSMSGSNWIFRGFGRPVKHGSFQIVNAIQYIFFQVHSYLSIGGGSEDVLLLLFFQVIVIYPNQSPLLRSCQCNHRIQRSCGLNNLQRLGYLE